MEGDRGRARSWDTPQAHHGFRVSLQGPGACWSGGDVMHNAAVQFTRPDVTFVFDADQSGARSTRKTLLPQLVHGV